MSALPPETELDLRAAIVNIEQRVTDLALAVDRQNVQISHLIDMLGGLRNSTDWSAAQVGELLRILFTGIQQIRDTQIGSLLADGPITLTDLQQLQATSHEQAQALVASRRARKSVARRVA